MEIKNITDFLEVFPQGSVDIGRTEYHSPCPFCSGGMGTPSIIHENHIFWGTDRLVWRLNDNSFYCRVCQRDGRGHNGNYFATEAAAFFSLSFDPILSEPAKPKTDTPIAYWTYPQILTAHANVQRDFWYRFGWTDEVIDHFKLGYGTLYQQDGAVNVIPMSVRTALAPPIRDLYYMSGRRHDLPAKRASGSIHNYFWLIHEDQDSTTVAFAEGEKDAITLWYLGYRNIAVTFGTQNWNQQKTKYLSDTGFTEIIAFGDNDEAGLSLNHRITAWGKQFGMIVRSYQWDTNVAKKFDITDQLEAMGKDALLEHINNRLGIYDVEVAPSNNRPAYIADYTEVDPHYKVVDVETTTLDILRGNGDGSIQQQIGTFLDTYATRKHRGRGVIKLLYVPPGGGKTHALVRTSQQISRIAQERSFLQLRALRQDIARSEAALQAPDCPEEDKPELRLLVETLKDRADNFSHTSVLIATQFKNGYNDILAAGANSNLIYNYEARNPDNCQNHQTVVALGNKNHDIGMFCATACPFKQACQQGGYLAQEHKRRSRPITVVRHQHLLNQTLVDEYKDLIIVDEAPFHILETPLLVNSVDIVPHVSEWSLGIGDEFMVRAIELFTAALRVAINTNVGQSQYTKEKKPNPEYTISGAAFLKLVDNHIQNATQGSENLESVVSAISYKALNDNYQPTFRGGNESLLMLRCVPAIYKVVENEIQAFVRDDKNTLPSCLHLVGGRLEVYQMQKIKISSNIPVIAADATSLIPELYDAAFGRELDIFAPQIVNKNAETVVIRGRDWTLSQIESNIGKELRDRNKRISSTVSDVSGDLFNLAEIPTNPSLYNSSLVKDYLDVVLALAERHTDLLVVTHKRIRGAVEDVLKHSYPKVYERLAFGHYNALRGTNAYKNYEAVVLIGVNRIPYDVMWRKIQAWANLLQVGETVPNTMSYFSDPYHSTTSGHSYYTFEHSFARRYAQMVEAGEMQQCMERIRPHAGTEKKTVYVCASRPVANFVTRIITHTELLNFYRTDSKINRVRDYMLSTHKATKKFATKEDVMKKYGCGYSTYKKARELAEQSLETSND